VISPLNQRFIRAIESLLDNLAFTFWGKYAFGCCFEAEDQALQAFGQSVDLLSFAKSLLYPGPNSCRQSVEPW